MLPERLGWPFDRFIAYGDSYQDHLKRGIGYYPYLGADILAAAETPVFTVHPGYAEPYWNDPNYGNYVDVIAPWGRTRYAHLSRINIAAPQDMGYPALIGYVGSTGRSSGPHLHIELWDDSQPQGAPYFQRVDPQLYLTPPPPGTAPTGVPQGIDFGTIGCAPMLAAIAVAGASLAFILWRCIAWL